MTQQSENERSVDCRMTQQSENERSVDCRMTQQSENERSVDCRMTQQSENERSVDCRGTELHNSQIIQGLALASFPGLLVAKAWEWQGQLIILTCLQ